jgi:hypothetical protein
MLTQLGGSALSVHTGWQILPVVRLVTSTIKPCLDLQNAPSCAAGSCFAVQSFTVSCICASLLLHIHVLLGAVLSFFACKVAWDFGIWSNTWIGLIHSLTQQ